MHAINICLIAIALIGVVSGRGLAPLSETEEQNGWSEFLNDESEESGEYIMEDTEELASADLESTHLPSSGHFITTTVRPSQPTSSLRPPHSTPPKPSSSPRPSKPPHPKPTKPTSSPKPPRPEPEDPSNNSKPSHPDPRPPTHPRLLRPAPPRSVRAQLILALE